MSAHRRASRSGPAQDGRLAVGALGAWAAVWWGLGHAAAAIALVAGLAVLLAAGAAVLQHRLSGPAPDSASRAGGAGGAGRTGGAGGTGGTGGAGGAGGALGVIAFVLCCGTIVLAPLAVRIHQVQTAPLTRLAKAQPTITADVVLRSDPRPMAAKGPNGASRSIIEASVTSVAVRGRRLAAGGPVLLFVPSDSWAGLVPGQRLTVEAKLLPPRHGNLLAASLAVSGAPLSVGRPPWWQRGAAAVRAGLRRASASLPSDVRGLLPGIVDGDTADLDPVLVDRFRTAGLTHLVAVSGTNCSIIVGIVAMLLVRARASPATVAVLSLLVLVGFVIVARPSPSVLRAAVMAAIGLLATAAGRPRAALPALGAAVIALLVWQPELAVDLGFMLSVAATVALLLVAPRWAAGLARCHVPPGVAEPIAVAAAAHIVTAPLVAAVSGRFSLVAIPANILAEPVVAPATVLGVLAAVASVISLPVAVVFAQLAGWPCRWLVRVAERFGAVDGAQLPWPGGLAGAALMTAVTVAVLLALRRALGKVLVLVALVCSLIVQFPGRHALARWPMRGWLVTACDVGQGDAVVVPAGSGSGIVIDAGPEPAAVDRCLRGLGVTRIPLLVITHFHLDHVGGIAGVVHGRSVDRVLVSPLADPVSGVRDLVAALGQRRDLIHIPRVGESMTVGVGSDAVTLTVLGPDHAFHNTRSDPNNSSVVLMAVSHGRRILLTGDADVEAQDALLASGTDLRADVLKVPHHGSAYTDPAFLAAVHARIALISVGAGNDYGHPSPLLLQALTRFGMTGYRTDQLGDVAVAAEAGGLEVVARSSSAAAARAPPPQPELPACRPPVSDARATMARCHSKRHPPR